MSEAIGLVGLGSMELPLANNLIESGYKLGVYNRTAQKAQPLNPFGRSRRQSNWDITAVPIQFSMSGHGCESIGI